MIICWKKVNIARGMKKKKNSDSPRITLAQEKIKDDAPEGMVCIECQNHSVFNEGGCLTCRECGWSKCD